jgi:hypothetical protein
VDKKNMIIVAAFLLGVMFADKVRSLPVLNKLPTIG